MKRVTAEFIVHEYRTETVEVADEYSEGDLLSAYRMLHPFDDVNDVVDYEEEDPS